MYICGALWLEIPTSHLALSLAGAHRGSTWKMEPGKKFPGPTSLPASMWFLHPFRQLVSPFCPLLSSLHPVSALSLLILIYFSLLPPELNTWMLGCALAPEITSFFLLFLPRSISGFLSSSSFSEGSYHLQCLAFWKKTNKYLFFLRSRNGKWGPYYTREI